MQRLLGRVAVLLLLCALAVVAVRVAGPEPEIRVRESTGTTKTVVVLPAGQAKVRGEVDTLTADADVLDPIAVPFSVAAPNAVIGAALTDGTRVSAEWDGRRELRVEGDGDGIDVSPAKVSVGKGYVVASLDGTPRQFLPGAYRTAAPLVVASAALGTPRQGLAFTADASTTLVAQGAIWGLPRRMRLDGPGAVEIVGRLTVRTRDDERTAGRVRFGPGSFEVVLTPRDGGGWTIDATLQGPIDVQG